jgi:hypothetical protein
MHGGTIIEHAGKHRPFEPPLPRRLATEASPGNGFAADTPFVRKEATSGRAPTVRIAV